MDSHSSNETEKGLQTQLDGMTSRTDVSNIHYGTQPPPMDGGINAWLFLAACFVMEALVWGFAFTYGVFQAYYTDLPQFKDSGNIAVVGTCAMVNSNILCSNPTRANLYTPGNHVSRPPSCLRRL